MDISWEKWLVMFLLALLSVLLGLIPYWIFANGRFKSISGTTSSLRYKVSITVLTSFGGGVLLSTAITHMLPEGREAVLHVPSMWTHIDAEFPLAEVLILVGFVVIYVVEELAHFILTGGEEQKKCPDSIARHNSIAHAHPHFPSDHELEGGATERNQLNVPPFLGIGTSSKGDYDNEKHTGSSLGSTDYMVPEVRVTGHEDHSHVHAVASSVRSFLGLLALSFHAIMEGIAVGIQQADHVWVMFGAVASHKFVISFCMGLELYTTKAKQRTAIISIVFFGVISSVGILIGSLISDANTETAPLAVLKNMATGTLLYVIFFEILNREREKRSQGEFKTLSRTIGFVQVISFIIGLILMTVLITTVGNESHSHGGEEDGHAHEEDALTTTTHDPDHDHLRHNLKSILNKAF